MSKNKKQPQPESLDEQPEPQRQPEPYPVEQVLETARMLYMLRPFRRNARWRWHTLVRQACAWLEGVQGAYTEIARECSEATTAYRKVEELHAKLEKLPDPIRNDCDSSRGSIKTSITRWQRSTLSR